MPRVFFGKRIKLMIRRHIDPSKERAFKKYSNDLINKAFRLAGIGAKSSPRITYETKGRLKAGDWVRVRPLNEIKNSLNHWNQVKGCTFMPEMARYCGTTQRILKVMNRFVDERDFRIKNSSGIILLKGVICPGTQDFGHCDRACFHFFRKEWLEKIEPSEGGVENGKTKEKMSNEWVRVRPLNEIKDILKYNSSSNNCLFVPEMEPYCGTRQRVLKRMTRFVDERDLKAKRTSNLVLLDGVTCQGGSEIGGCDRACHFMWKNEWLKQSYGGFSIEDRR